MISHIITSIILFGYSITSAFANSYTIEKPGKIPDIPTEGAVSLLSSIIAYAIGLAAILGVIGITWGGIQMVLALGEDEKLKKAKSIMIYSVVGVILSGLAFSLVQLISTIRI